MTVMIVAVEAYKDKKEILCKRAIERKIQFSETPRIGRDGKKFYIMHFTANEETIRKFVADSKDVLKRYNKDTIVVA